MDGSSIILLRAHPTPILTFPLKGKGLQLPPFQGEGWGRDGLLAGGR